jgi:hypothetical protein
MKNNGIVKKINSFNWYILQSEFLFFALEREGIWCRNSLSQKNLFFLYLSFVFLGYLIAILKIQEKESK